VPPAGKHFDKSGETMSATRQEIEQAMQDLEQKISKIREKVTEIDDQIKTTSVNSVEKVEGELEQLKNRYYEVQARELIGEFDDKLKREVEDNIQAAERKLKADNDRLQNLVGIRHALELEFKKTQAAIEQHQAAFERTEFENLKLDRQRIVEEINQFQKKLESLFARVSEYNLNSVGLVTRILNREYQVRGVATGSKLNGDSRERVQQLAEPFDLNHIKNSLAEAIAEVVVKHLGS
jgi:DNA repair exonuclease SbcCD ATPase subunit